MLRYHRMAEDEMVILFFGLFYVPIKRSDLLLDSLPLYFHHLLNTKARMNEEWIGCLSTFCFNFDVDFAYVLDDKIIFGKGRDDYAVEEWPPTKPPGFHATRDWPKTAGKFHERMVPVAAYVEETDVVKHVVIYNNNPENLSYKIGVRWEPTNSTDEGFMFINIRINEYILAAFSIDPKAKHSNCWLADKSYSITLNSSTFLNGDLKDWNLPYNTIDAAFVWE